MGEICLKEPKDLSTLNQGIQGGRRVFLVRGSRKLIWNRAGIYVYYVCVYCYVFMYMHIGICLYI